jgi:hypothetical protein|tara:strand:+ start:2647 stop:3087 length:441 start_codon:yes stop_codon:yes gene_type:complete
MSNKERCEKLVADLTYLFGKMNITAELRIENDDDDDVYVEIDGWINMIPKERILQSMSTRHRQTSSTWLPFFLSPCRVRRRRSQKVVTILGVHTFSNGDPGYPDDVEVQDDDKNIEDCDACSYVICKLTIQEVDNLLTEKAEESCP